MIYRRFGKTALQMPVLTCGGMRYQQSWEDLKTNGLDTEGQANLEACIHQAIAHGINHIETARGYGSSEYQLGLVLPSLPRDEIIVQTKIGPKDNEEDFLKTFDLSMKHLQLDYVDLLGVHGINTPILLRKTLKGGTLKAIRKLQNEGRVRHVGFSTHGPTQTIVDAIETDEFSYVNLHWYYFDQCNWRAVEAATQRDMGVFIISPNDKGGKLYDPPQKLVNLCTPLSPMGFNSLFCLSHEQVHTISLGVAKPSDFDAHVAILPQLADGAAVIEPILQRLHDEAVKRLGADWVNHWQERLPDTKDVPGNLPLYHILRMRNMAKAYDMEAYGKMRYNLLGNGGHWFPGAKVENVDWPALGKCLEGYAFAEQVPPYLREAHALFNAEDGKRLSEDGET
ncbi:MAG: aldo/keto reductase [Verrucomicrobia bacterium]|nr:aldo/keto reductase [Verrucomicrobiota bacterium]